MNTRTENRREMCKDCPLDPNSGKCGEHSMMKKILWAVLGSGAVMIIMSWSTRTAVTDLTSINGPIAKMTLELSQVAERGGQNSRTLAEIRRDVKQHLEDSSDRRAR